MHLNHLSIVSLDSSYVEGLCIKCNTPYCNVSRFWCIGHPALLDFLILLQYTRLRPMDIIQASQESFTYFICSFSSLILLLHFTYNINWLPRSAKVVFLFKQETSRQKPNCMIEFIMSRLHPVSYNAGHIDLIVTGVCMTFKPCLCA